MPLRLNSSSLTSFICALAAIMLQLVTMECQKLHMVDSPVYQYMSCGLICCGFNAFEVKFFQLNQLHLCPGCHYAPVCYHGMPKTSNGGFAYRVFFNIWCQSKDMADFHILQGKLEPPTLSKRIQSTGRFQFKLSRG